MKRLAIGFSIVVMVLLFASVAGAVPPNFCDDGRVHPACPDPDPSTTTTTTEPGTTTTTTTTTEAPTGLAACPDTKTIDGSGQMRFECLWQPIDDGSATATVTISEITGAVKDPPFLFVRDDSPGDICVLRQSDDWDPPTENGYEASFDLFYATVPTGEAVDYSPWLGHSYWDFKRQAEMEPGTHWCAPQDPVLWSIREDNNGGALHFQINFNARGGGSVTFTLTPSNSL